MNLEESNIIISNGKEVQRRHCLMWNMTTVRKKINFKTIDIGLFLKILKSHIVHDKNRETVLLTVTHENGN